MSAARLSRLGGLTAVGALLCFHAASGPHAFDTGELVAAAFALGGSHPPGQPLHAILGFAATLLPLGPAAFRVTLVSVAGALLAAVVAGLFAVRLARTLATSEPSPRVLIVLSVVVPFAVLVSPPLLRQATRPEVYTLALALFGVAMLALVSSTRCEGVRPASFAAGLAACLHPPHALAALLAIGLFLFVVERHRPARQRALVWSAAFFLLGLLPLAYLPFRAFAGAEVWGDPTTLSGFWDYLSARAYRQNLGSAGGSFFAQVAAVLRYLPYAAGLVPLFGLLALSRRARDAEGRKRHLLVFALATTFSALAAALITPIDQGVPDMVAYAGPVTLLLIAVGAAGMALLPRTRYALLGLAGITLSLFALRDAPSAIDADAPTLDALGASLVTTPPPRSMVVLTQDFAASTWLMERATADARPDVAIFVSGLATSSWHWRTLASHPASDGTPVEAEGRDARERYTRGAMEAFAGEVPIVVEMDAQAGGAGTLAGPYLLGDPRVRVARLSASSGERLAPAIAALARDGPAGDHGVVHAIYREYQATRARRLALRREPALAARASRWALIHPDSVESALLQTVPPPREGAHMAPVVAASASVGIDRGTALRQGAVLLALGGATDAALDLLDHQSPSDPRALLEAAWIALTDGRPGAAREALDAFDARAPELRDEGAALRQQLP